MYRIRNSRGVLAHGALALLLVWSAALVACSDSRARAAFEAKLALSLETARLSGEAVRMAEVTDFDWDTLHVFPPYVSADMVRKDLGFEWSGARDLDFDQDNQLVFVKDGKVVMDLLLLRAKGDFTTVGKSRFTPTDAIFRYQRRNGGLALGLDGAAGP